MSSKRTKLKQKLFMILIYGPMGAGKTTVAKILHTKLKRTSYIGLDRIKPYISDFKRNHSDNEISRNVVLAMLQEYLKQGINVIIEHSMGKKEVKVFKKIAKKYNADCFIYHLNAPKLLLKNRVFSRMQSPGKFQVSKARIERNYRIYIKNRYLNAAIFDSEKLSSEQIVKLILKEVKN